MLVTTCRHCGARFRVTPDQLNLRQGQVRCGECHEVFNGFEALERFPGDDTGARLLASRAGKEAGAARDPGLTGGEFGSRASAGPGPSREAPPADLPDIPDLPDQEEPPATPAFPPDRAAPAPAAAPAPSRQAAVSLEEALVAPPDARPSRAWAFGVVLLVLVMAMQLAYAFRARLAQQYPAVRPVLESACARAGCTVPYVNDEAALKLEDSELLEVPGKPGQIALQARVRNLSASAQEFPHLELTLTDVTGQTAVRRVLRPADYLGREPVTGDVMAGGSEALVSIRLQTDRIKPTGYELLVFYP